MSTVYGVYSRSGVPVGEKVISDMQKAVNYWRPDDSGLWCGSEIALGHEMLWNTPQSLREHFPVEEEHVVLTMDARIDNREELVASLGLRGKRISEITDGQLILTAYEKWGEECPKYLVGDFVFAIWDKLKRRLFLARDHMGIRPLYYYVTESILVFSNDLKGVVEHPDVSTELCDEAVASYLIGLHSKRTFFKDIQKLPAGHAITVSSSSFRVLPYWNPEATAKTKLSSIEEYADRLRALIQQAVYDRMRTSYPVTSHLSGGLDSSAISVIAARKLAESKQALLAFNWLHEPGECDDLESFEWANSAAIAQVENIDHSYVSLNARDITEYLKQHDIAYGDSQGLWYENVVRKTAGQRGSRTILSGWGGDQFATYHGASYLSDMLSRGHWLKLGKELFQMPNGRKRGVKSALRMLYHGALTAFVPRSLYHKIPKNKQYAFSPPYHLISDSFLPVFQKEASRCLKVNCQPWPTIRKEMLDCLADGGLQNRTEAWAAGAFYDRLEYSYPLLDKRVVEFILGIPASCFVCNQTGRYLFRRAMKGVLPESILWETKEAESNRINKLIELSSVVFRELIEDFLKTEAHSKYIDLDALQQEFAQRNNNEEGRAIIVMNTWLALSVMMMEKKR